MPQYCDAMQVCVFECGRRINNFSNENLCSSVLVAMETATQYQEQIIYLKVNEKLMVQRNMMLNMSCFIDMGKCYTKISLYFVKYGIKSENYQQSFMIFAIFTGL